MGSAERVHNFCHVVKTLRVTPAMQAGLTDHIWSLEEFMAVVLAELPAEKPVAVPLAHREPEAPSRALPSGRGFLRLVTEPLPARRHVKGLPDAPPPPPATPATSLGPTITEAPRHPEQLSLFGSEPPDFV